MIVGAKCLSSYLSRSSVVWTQEFRSTDQESGRKGGGTVSEPRLGPEKVSGSFDLDRRRTTVPQGRSEDHDDGFFPPTLFSPST